MSSSEVNLLSISLKQYFYKLKAHTGLVNRLIITQMLALFFSLGGVNSMSYAFGSGNIFVSVSGYSANIVIVFSMMWIISVAILLTTKEYKRMEMPLVGNRVSANLSDIGFLMTTSVFAGITASLVSVLLRVIMYFTFDRSKMVLDGFFLSYSDLFMGMGVAILYMILISAIGYFLGSMSLMNMVILILLATPFVGIFRVYNILAQMAFNFIAFENSLPLFALKVICISIVLFGASLLLSNRKEVRQ